MTFRIIRYAVTLGVLWCAGLETGPATVCVLLGILIILEVFGTFLGNACLADRDALLTLARRERALREAIGWGGER